MACTHQGRGNGQGRARRVGTETLRAPHCSSSARRVAVFFGGSTYLLRVAVVSEASYHRPLGAPQDDEAGLAYQVEAVAGWQPRGLLLVTHGDLFGSFLAPFSAQHHFPVPPSSRLEKKAPAG